VTSAIIPCKDGNQLNADLYKKLLVAWNNSSSLAWRITEAYPPTVQHQSKCHNNGMCVDVALTGDKSCTNIAKLEKILRNAGLTVLNEYVGCGGVETQFSTGGHFHVQ